MQDALGAALGYSDFFSYFFYLGFWVPTEKYQNVTMVGQEGPGANVI